MDLSPFFKSVLEQDDAPIVLCGLDHTILYMNPTAIRRYEKRGGAALVGRNLLDCHNEASRQAIRDILDWFQASPAHNRVFTGRNEKDRADIYVIALRDDTGNLIGYYEKHAVRAPESGKIYDFQA